MTRTKEPQELWRCTMKKGRGHYKGKVEGGQDIEIGVEVQPLPEKTGGSCWKSRRHDDGEVVSK